MFKVVVILFILVSYISCGQEREIMYRIFNDDTYECGYVNENGDTLVPFGECIVCYSDSLNYAIVVKSGNKSRGLPAINAKGNIIFHVFPFDNGPDYIEDGTFRIIDEGKIGYATEEGEIIIPPKFEAAQPFKNGRALVSFKASTESDGEHSWWVDADWFYIDKNGNRHENQE